MKKISPDATFVVAVVLVTFVAVVILAFLADSNPHPPATSLTDQDPFPYAAAIDIVLGQDYDAYSPISMESDEEEWRTYIETVSSIDLRSCPEDFQQAFLRYRFSQDNIYKLLCRYGNGGWGIFLCVVEGATGIAFVRLEELDEDVINTWRECEVTALRHGANTAVYFREERRMFPGYGGEFSF